MTEDEDKHEFEPDLEDKSAEIEYTEFDKALLAAGAVHDVEREKSGETLIHFPGPEGTKAMNERFGEEGDGGKTPKEDAQASDSKA